MLVTGNLFAWIVRAENPRVSIVVVGLAGAIYTRRSGLLKINVLRMDNAGINSDGAAFIPWTLHKPSASAGIGTLSPRPRASGESRLTK